MSKAENVWASRKIARRIAKARMARKNIQHIYRPDHFGKSYFARHWREVAAR